MKKTYTKPGILFESFTISTNIAADCDVIAGNPSEGSCGYKNDKDPTGRTVFISEMTGCERHEADGEFNSICYHVPADIPNLFNS